MRRLHPLRLQYELFSHANPFMRPILSNLEWVRENRQPVSKNNPFWQAQEWFSDWIETSLDAYRDVRDQTSEALFHAIYGSPLVQALVGLKASDTRSRQRPGKDAAHQALVAQRIQELKDQIPEGGPREAVIRALLYIRMPDGVVDERGFNLLRRMREEAGKGLTLMAFKDLVREQFSMLLLDERRAVDAIPSMLDQESRPCFAHDKHSWPGDRGGRGAKQRIEGTACGNSGHVRTCRIGKTLENRGSRKNRTRYSSSGARRYGREPKAPLIHSRVGQVHQT